MTTNRTVENTPLDRDERYEENNIANSKSVLDALASTNWLHGPGSMRWVRDYRSKLF